MEAFGINTGKEAKDQSNQMTELIDVLPGIKLPVGAVSEELSKMWGGNKNNALSEFRA